MYIYIYRFHVNIYIYIYIYIYILTCNLKGGMAGPEEIDVVRQQIDKHVSAAADTHATIDELFEVIFSLRSVPRVRHG
jgi:hypothetical protein